MSFHIGQRVRVNLPGSVNHGVITVVASELHCGPVRELDGRLRRVWHYDVPLRGTCAPRAAYEPHELIPIDDELGSWSELADIWVPREIA